jgi:hypothetical protein
MPDPTHSPVPPDRVDPNVTLPPSIAAVIQRGADAHASVYAPQTDQGQPQGNGNPPPNANGQGELPLVQPELSETNPDGSVNWENRFKALKGRYDADSRRWNESQQQYDARMRELTAQANPPPPLPGAGNIPVLVSQKDIDDYGADLIDVIKRAAQEAVLPLLTPIATTVGQVQARVETTEAETGKAFLNRMHSSMDSMIPGWNDLNKDPNFIAWTKRPDVYSGLNRQEMLQRAWYAGDSNRVAAFFQGFLAEEAATDPAAAQARAAAQGDYGGHAAGPAPTGQPPAPQRVTLEQLAAPGRARAAAIAPAGKPVWTAAGISQFYMDVAAGKFRGRDADRIATEADLMAAQREGRIQVNPRTATTLSGS